MVKVNILAEALKTLVNAEKMGKKQVLLRPVSKVLLRFLRIM
jgi:small subunit ribosomal protein S15Ae